ncbi:MAG TPA: type ISP restriction/modification enzyme [Terriglobales bacterium]|nr:type ISP restriction/modification enzyme [Terriglobales bacterium]
MCVSDWALEQFRTHYHDPSISKWDIFHYVYAVLHHPEYRQRYAANLRRELPRIPFVAANSTELSSRAEEGDSLANHPAESREPGRLSAGHRPEKEFPAQEATVKVRGRNTSPQQLRAPADSRSLDSGERVRNRIALLRSG